MNNEIVKNLSICFLASITAFIVTPVFMIGNNPGDYSFIIFKTFIVSGILFSIMYFTIIASISGALSLFKMEKMASISANFNLYWILTAGLLFPLAESTGMVNPDMNPTDVMNFIWVVIITFTLCVLTMMKIKKYLYFFSITVIVISFVSSAISIYSSGIINTSSDTYKSQKTLQKRNTHPSLKLSKNRNILVISFDGIPGEFVTKIIKENSSFANKLKDFLVFENAVSQSPATAASLMGDIYGVIDYKSKGKTVEQAKETIIFEGIEASLLKTYIPDTYSYGYDIPNIKKVKLPSVKEGFDGNTLAFFKYPVVRIWTSHPLKKLYWGDKIQNAIDRIILIEPNEELFKNIRFHKGFSWDKDHIMSLFKFKSFMSSIETNDKDISLRYMHFTFTHFPVDLDENCEYRSYDQLWYDSNQNEKGVKGEATCSVGIFIAFLEKLKQLDIYNNSLIIFKSDHGKPVSYLSTHPNNLTINNSTYWGYNRYRPTLMVKGMGVDNDKVTFKSELVLTNDIARTTCESSSLNIECHNIEGVNLLGENLDNGKPYYLYVPKNKGSDFEFKNHISVKVLTRKISLLDAMESSHLIDLSLPIE